MALEYVWILFIQFINGRYELGEVRIFLSLSCFVLTKELICHAFYSRQLAHIFTKQKKRKSNLFTPERSIVWENFIFSRRKQSILHLMTFYTEDKRLTCIIDRYISHDKCRTAKHIFIVLTEDNCFEAYVHLSKHSIISLNTSVQIDDGDVNLGRNADMIVLVLSLSLLWYSIVNVHLSIVENNLFLYCSRLNMHTCRSVDIRTTYKLPSPLNIHVSYCENLIFFLSEQYVSQKSWKENEWLNCISNWSDSWRKCIATWKRKIHHVFCSFSFFSHCSCWLTEGEWLYDIYDYKKITKTHSLMRRKGIKLMRWNVCVVFSSLVSIFKEFNLVSFRLFLVFTRICEWCSL